MLLLLCISSPCRLDPHPIRLNRPDSPAGEPLFETLPVYLLDSLPVWLCWAMKIPLWYLVVLLASLFTPGRSDCQGECVACGVLLQQQQLEQVFNTMVRICVCVCLCVCVCVCVIVCLRESLSALINSDKSVCARVGTVSPWWKCVCVCDCLSELFSGPIRASA